MLTLFIVLQVVLILFIVVLVLLQAGKGAEIGAVFGGPSTQTLFGGAGAGNILTRITTIAIFLFMMTSMGIAYLKSKESASTLMQKLSSGRSESVTAPTTSSEHTTENRSPSQEQTPPTP